MAMLKTITPIDNSIYVEREYASSDEIDNSLSLAKTIVCFLMLSIFFPFVNPSLSQVPGAVNPSIFKLFL